MSEDFPVFQKIVWNVINNCAKDTMTEFPSGKFIMSAVFEVPIGSGITKWKLALQPNNISSRLIMMFLIPKDLPKGLVINWSLYFIGKSGKYGEASFRKGSEGFEIGGFGMGFKRFLSRAKFAKLFDELITDGNLKVGCEIVISSPDQFPIKSSGFKVSDDIQRMFEDESFADFELKCNDGQKLKCHKVILAARSPVYREMLSNDMKEIHEGFVEVPDFDSTVIKEVLRFIYCDRVENLNEISSELIFAADKYNLEDLKQICIRNIFQNLSRENVIEALLITEKVSGGEKLFKECVVVIARDLMEITQSLDWEKLSKDMVSKIMIQAIRMITSNCQTTTL